MNNPTLTDAQLKVLKDIQDSVPKEWREKLITVEDKTPTMKFVVNEAIDKKLVKDELVEKLRVLRDNGEFDKKKEVVNPKLAKLIDQWVDRRIKKAIKNGQLPPRAKKK
jgi:hypothetical protein